MPKVATTNLSLKKVLVKPEQCLDVVDSSSELSVTTSIPSRLRSSYVSKWVDTGSF